MIHRLRLIKTRLIVRFLRKMGWMPFVNMKGMILIKLGKNSIFDFGYGNIRLDDSFVMMAKIKNYPNAKKLIACLSKRKNMDRLNASIKRNK